MMMDFKDGVQQVSTSLRFGKDLKKQIKDGDLIGTKFFEIFFSVATTQQMTSFFFSNKK